MRQEPGLTEHRLRHARHVVECRFTSECFELLACHPVALLGLVAEGEQRFAAARGGACAREGENLVDRHVRALSAPGRVSERAVVTDVAAELRQRDEDLRRVGHEAAVSLLAKRPSFGAQIHQRPLEQLHLQELTLRACCYETTRRSS